jgi:hypothetical protein
MKYAKLYTHRFIQEQNVNETVVSLYISGKACEQENMRQGMFNANE